MYLQTSTVMQPLVSECLLQTDLFQDPFTFLFYTVLVRSHVQLQQDQSSPCRCTHAYIILHSNKAGIRHAAADGHEH